MRGQTPPGLPPVPLQPDLAVVGPLARSAADLSLALDLLAGPDEVEAIAYSLTLPPPRADRLDGFRVLVLDTHPQLPTSAAVRAAIDGVAEGLERAGARVARQSPLLPDLTMVMRCYMTLLMSIFDADVPERGFEELRQRAAGIPSDVDTLGAQRARGLVATHRDWIKADRIRAAINAQWRELFRTFDVVVCPVTQTPAFPHDHSPDQRARAIVIDGARHSYQDQLTWPSLATLSGYRQPWRRSAARRKGCRSACKSSARRSRTAPRCASPNFLSRSSAAPRRRRASLKSGARHSALRRRKAPPAGRRRERRGPAADAR